MGTGAVAFAGCLTASDDTSGNNGSNSDRDEDQIDDNNDSDGSDNDGETDLSLIDASVVDRWSGCANGDAGVTVFRDGAVYLIDGIAMAPNPCHEAVLSDTNVVNNGLRASVEVTHAELGEDKECVECHGAVGYNLLAEVEAPDFVERVLVSHGNDEFEILPAEFSTDPFVYETEIKTTGAECGDIDLDEASASFENGTLTVNGRLSASNPCHEAQLDNISLVGGEVNVEVSLTTRTNGGKYSNCTSCIGEITYEVTAEFINGEITEEIVVNHIGGEIHRF